MCVASCKVLYGVGKKRATNTATQFACGVIKCHHGVSLVVATRVMIAACAFACGKQTHLV